MSADDSEERLVRALRAPGSDLELSAEEQYRAMFRAARSEPAAGTTAGSRAPRRLLLSTATAVVLAVGTGGLAAAYTGKLPTPIQTFAHHVIGAPEAPPSAPSSGAPLPRRTESRPASSSPALPSTSPSSAPTAGVSHPVRRRGPSARPSPSAKPSASAISSTSPANSAPGPPTSTPEPAPAPTPTGVTLTAASHQADVGTSVSFSGQVTYTGTSTAAQGVVLLQRVGSRWTPVANGVTDDDGSVTVTAPPLQRTSSFRLRAGHGPGAVRSAPWRVAMHPLLTTSVTAMRKRASIAVATEGGFAGDVVTLTTRRDGYTVVVARGRLDDDGSVTFTVTPGQRRTSYAVTLAPTTLHTASRAGVVVNLIRAAG